MARKDYAEILADARQLTRAEQEQLVADLARATPLAGEPQPPADGKVRTLYDALNDRGLVGFINDGPSDLSTNPKYMEGFGRDAG